MKIKAFVLVFFLLASFNAAAEKFEYEYGGTLRGLAGYNFLAQTYQSGQNRFHAPLYGDVKNAFSYHFNEDMFLKISAGLKAKTGSNLDNFNQGRWGEEVYGQFSSAYGDFYIGQMPNAATMLGVTRPNLPIWQPAPAELVDFINNPNWQQHNRRKYYNTLTSTAVDTDGSSFKFSYLTPEFAGTTLAVTYTPENNTNDSLTSKFSPYYKESAYSITLYNQHSFDFGDTEIYFTFADFEKSHQEYAGGISFYRKGWTAFASYRQTEITGHDFPIATQNVSANMPAYFDGFRNGYAWNAGLAYEWALVTSTISYFESQSDDTQAANRIINWHTSIKPYKHLGFYFGMGYADFRAGKMQNESGNRGGFGYAGAEISF